MCVPQAFKYLHKARRATRAVYNSFWLQMFVATVIVCSFTVDVTEAEVLPEQGSQV